MDALPLSPVELLGLGSALALSGLCYYVHRRRARAAARLQDAPKLVLDEDLPHLVSAASGRLPYVALEGIVLPVGAALASPHHRQLQGVIQKLLLKEHRLVWNSLAGSWSESERVLSEQVHTVPFTLAPPGPGTVPRVSVESPLCAVKLPLETVYEHFQQPAHGFKDLIGHYLSGEKPKGFLETEEMLQVGASLTGIGELVLHPDGTLHLQPPGDGADYFLCLRDWQTLLAELESLSRFWKGAAMLCGLASLTILLLVLCRVYRQRYRQEQEDERQELGTWAGASEPEVDGPEDACVICLVQVRECVLLPCGHVCCCFRCFEALPCPTCPICRSPIDRVVPLYQA